MTKFLCTACNFRFEAEKKREKCPYCGKPNVVREPDAQELLED